MIRRHGLMRPGRVVRLIALVLVVGMVAGAGLGVTYLIEARLPVWVVMLAVLLVLAVPIVAALRSDRDSDQR